MAPSFFDNFFTSKKLLCDLESVGTYGCGTDRKDRLGFPEQLKKSQVEEKVKQSFLSVVANFLNPFIQ